jgi:hypothetical protein
MRHTVSRVLTHYHIKDIALHSRFGFSATCFHLRSGMRWYRYLRRCEEGLLAIVASLKDVQANHRAGCNRLRVQSKGCEAVLNFLAADGWDEKTQVKHLTNTYGAVDWQCICWCLQYQTVCLLFPEKPFHDFEEVLKKKASMPCVGTRYEWDLQLNRHKVCAIVINYNVFVRANTRQ